MSAIDRVKVKHNGVWVSVELATQVHAKGRQPGQAPAWKTPLHMQVKSGGVWVTMLDLSFTT